jgi:natural product biosynthesis luciferase-like monooxygenase protein
VVEDWCVVDCLSHGRAAISLGSGWNVNDFLLSPDRYRDRRGTLVDGARLVADTWMSGRFRGRNGEGHEIDVSVLPRPVQGRLPLWITASKSEQTFRAAGRLGANVLTHLETQNVDALATKIAAYREERVAGGHDPNEGRVTVMQHTFVAKSGVDARSTAEPHLKRYLGAAMQLETAAVNAGGLMSGRRRISADVVADPSLREELIAEAARRYVSSASLIGSVEECFERVEILRDVGVDEIACLVDFIDDASTVLAGLACLADLRRRYDRTLHEEERTRIVRTLMDDA